MYFLENHVGENPEETIHSLSAIEFEILCKRLMESAGFTVETTKTTGDGGIDLIAFYHQPLLSGKFIVQCKRYIGSVGEPIIRDLYGVVTSERANKGILMTTGHFTKSAAAFAKGKPIELIDGAALRMLLVQYGILVSRKAPAKQLRDIVQVCDLAQYRAALEQEWDIYHDYSKKHRRLLDEAKAVAEVIYDRKIKEIEDTISRLKQERGEFKLFGAKRNEELDKQIRQQEKQLWNHLGLERWRGVRSLARKLSSGPMDQEEFIQYASETESFLPLRAECDRAEERMRSCEKFCWDWSEEEALQSIKYFEENEEWSSKDYFEDEFRAKYLISVLSPCIEELGVVKVREFAQFTGFSEDEITDVDVQYECGVCETEDPHTGEILLVSKKLL